MKSKKNNYKLKIVDLDLYNFFKSRIKNTIKNKSEIYKKTIIYIEVFKKTKRKMEILQSQSIRSQPRKPKKIKAGGIVCNFDSEKEKGRILVELKKEVMNKPGDIVKDKQGNKIGFIKEVNNNKYFDKDDSRNNYGIVNDLIPIWKRKMKRSDFK